MRSGSSHTGLVAAALIVLAGSAARAGTTSETAPREPPRNRWEWVGLELSLAGYALLGPEFDRYSRRQLGPGGTIRLLRREWTHAYVTPLQLGLFVGNAPQTIYPHAEIEGGTIIRFGGGHRLEIGLGAGAGILSITYRDGCDGGCLIGGRGLQLAPAIRYRIALDSKVMLGFNTRAAIPLQVGEGAWGYFTGRGALILAGFDVGFGS